MRNLLYLTIFFIVLTNQQSIGQNTFNYRFYLNTAALEATSVIVEDSGYVVAGFLADTAPYHNARFFSCKTDLNGNILTSKSYGAINKNYYTSKRCLKKLSNNNYLCGGDVVSSITGKQNIFLIKFNNIGDTAFIKEYSSSDTTYNCGLTGILVLPDGGFLLLGHKMIMDANRNFVGAEVLLIKTDSLGNEVWRKHHGIPGNSYELATSISYDTDGKYLVGAHKMNVYYNNNNFQWQSWIFKTDSLGNRIWSSLSPTNQIIGQAFGFKRTSDNGFVYSSYYGYEIPSSGSHSDVYKKGYIIKLDSNRQKTWDVIIGDSSIPNYFSSIYELKDGSFVASGSYYTQYADSFSYDGWLVKVSAQGNLLWNRLHNIVVSDFAEHEIHDMKPTPDGGFICCGLAADHLFNPPPGQRGWLFKTDSMGCIVPGCHLIGVEDLKNDKNHLLIYPNPAKDFLNVYLKTDNHKDKYLYLTDLNGREIKKILIKNSDITFIIPVHDVPSGTYLLQLKLNNQSIKTKKIIIQH